MFIILCQFFKEIKVTLKGGGSVWQNLAWYKEGPRLLRGIETFKERRKL